MLSRASESLVNGSAVCKSASAFFSWPTSPYARPRACAASPTCQNGHAAKSSSPNASTSSAALRCESRFCMRTVFATASIGMRSDSSAARSKSFNCRAQPAACSSAADFWKSVALPSESAMNAAIASAGFRCRTNSSAAGLQGESRTPSDRNRTCRIGRRRSGRTSSGRERPLCPSAKTPSTRRRFCGFAGGRG